jgi:alpha/beta superfamily hydrolase
MVVEKFTFANQDGHQLAARLDLPEGPHLASALFAHCFTCSKDIPAAKRIAQRLAAQGIVVLRFDFTGLGHSGGEFSNTNFSTNMLDLLAATQAMTERGFPPSLLIGHSLGGAAVLAVADQIKSAKAILSPQTSLNTLLKSMQRSSNMVLLKFVLVGDHLPYETAS